MRRDVADLFGNTISFALWGFYCCLFAVTIWNVRTKRIDQWGATIMLALWALFFMNAFLFAVDLMTVYYEFDPAASIPSDRTMTILAMLADVAILSAMFIADSTICWRLWVIWLKNWRVMVGPGLILAGQFSASIATIIFEIVKICLGSSDDASTWEKRYQNAAQTALWLSLAVNILTTGLIVGRLWWADRQLHAIYSGSAPPRRYIKIIVAIVESGAIYTVFTVAYMVSNYIGDGTGQYLFVDSLGPIVGIVPTLIQLKLSLGYLQPNERTTGTVPVSTVKFGPTARGISAQTQITTTYSTADVDTKHQSLSAADEEKASFSAEVKGVDLA